MNGTTSDDTEHGRWEFCDIVQNQYKGVTQNDSGPNTIVPHSERLILEQHTETGEYRLRSLDRILPDGPLQVED